MIKFKGPVYISQDIRPSWDIPPSQDIRPSW